MSLYLITGSSRGLGLSISKILACKPSDQVSVVFASSKSRSAALDELIDANPGRIIFVQLDVSKRESVDEAVKRIEEVVGARGLDVLINNARILNYKRGGIINMYNAELFPSLGEYEWANIYFRDDLVSSFAVNVDGVQVITSAFMPKLHQGSRKLVVNM
jgi:NAD(P)-dependent dehydrogenase (short-subunit alcohol dehydrogenase family)